MIGPHLQIQTLKQIPTTIPSVSSYIKRLNKIPYAKANKTYFKYQLFR